MEEVDAAQLAHQAGVATARVSELAALGILPSHGPYRLRHVPRIRLADRLERLGVSLDSVGQAIADGELSLEFVDSMLLRAVDRIDVSLRNLSDRYGVSEQVPDAIRLALTVDDGSVGASVRRDEAQLLEAIARLVELGVDETVTIRLLQIMADNLSRMARATGEMWEEGVRQPMLQSGFAYRQVLGARAPDSPEFQILGERIVQLLWNRFMEEEILRGTASTIARALEQAGRRSAGAAKPPAVVFLDLTAFTQRTDDSGDEFAAAKARTLADVVRRRVTQVGGTVVKMLGDGAMLYFPDSAAAVRGSLSLVDDIAAAGLPPGRCGVNAGHVIVRDVDLFGHTVNVAARLVDYARPGEVLVTSEVVSVVEGAGIDFTEIGAVSLKGIGSLVTVYSAHDRG